MFFHYRHDWQTVAIDSTHGWHRINRKSGKETFKGQHIILFQKCECGARQIDATDPTEEGRKFALEQHCDVALALTKWVETGKVTGYTDDSITWVDPAYAPLKGWEEILKDARRDPKFKELLDTPSVSYAIDELEVLIKMHENT